MAHPQRRCAPQLDVELDGRVAHRLGERGQLRQAVEPFVGLAEDRPRVVAGREEDPPIGRGRDDRERLLHEPERLLRRVRVECRPRRLDREARRPGGVARSERVLGEHGQALGSRVASLGQQVHDRRMDLPPSRRRELARGELADLFVGERVIGRLALGLRQQEPGVDRRLEVVGERVGAVAAVAGAVDVATPRRPCRGVRVRTGIPLGDPRPDRPEVSEAEAAAQDRRVAERCPSGRGQSRGPPIDKRPDRRWHQPCRVPAESPLAVDLLERAGLAMGASQLLDDERHALGLDVHRGR